MNTTSPLFVLKRQAKALSQKAQIPYLTALDRVAQTQGFERWTLLLKSRIEDKNSANHVLTQLVPGDLLLLAARPGQGKTLFGLELLCLTIKQGRRGWFFTLEHNLSDVLDRLHDLGQKPSPDISSQVGGVPVKS